MIPSVDMMNLWPIMPHLVSMEIFSLHIIIEIYCRNLHLHFRKLINYFEETTYKLKKRFDRKGISLNLIVQSNNIKN